MSIDVMIPVYKPGKELKELVRSLKGQTVLIRTILIINTDRAFWREELVQGLEGVRVVHIRKEEFDHGGTRRMASRLCDGEFFVWMTQDAVPKDTHLIEELLKPFCRERVAVSYARQLPKEGCGYLERYVRSFNYPPDSCIKSAKEQERMGIKTFFSSNVCAMYRREHYEKVGGFVERTIFNEDMIFAMAAVKQGMAIAYQAEALVYHSHNYSNWQQFCRNFDLGVSQRQYQVFFSEVRSEDEGVRMIKRTCIHLFRAGKGYLLIPFGVSSAAKFMGYRMGKAYEKLPKWLVMRCTMNPEYWKT